MRQWPQCRRARSGLAPFLVSADCRTLTAMDDLIKPDDRTQPPGRGDERSTLAGFLALNRETVVMKAQGLSDADAARRLLPSLTTVSGIIRHLADVERSWFLEFMDGQDYARRYGGDEDPDGEFRVTAADSLEEIIADYRASWAESDTVIARLGLDDVPSRPDAPSLRWILAHMIEETARHLGHIDILREQLDGVTGE